MPLRDRPLPGPVRDLCDRFLSLAPDGLVTGLYLTGGIGFGEWFEGQSDVDFIATLDHRPTTEEVHELEQVHEQLAAVSRIEFDGMHVLAGGTSPGSSPPPPPTSRERPWTAPAAGACSASPACTTSSSAVR